MSSILVGFSELETVWSCVDDFISLTCFILNFLQIYRLASTNKEPETAQIKITDEKKYFNCRHRVTRSNTRLSYSIVDYTFAGLVRVVTHQQNDEK